MTIQRSVQVRQMGDLQTDAAGVVAQAEGSPRDPPLQRAGGVRRGVEQHREHQELDAALNRAIWALDVTRALRNVSEGKVKRWGEVAAMLKARYPGR